MVQKSFLRKSQDLHLDAVPTTYAQRSLRKRGSHTQALRFGAAQPFWTLSQRCCSNKKHTNQSNKQDKQDGLNHVTVSDYFFAVSLALSQKQPYRLTATIQLDCNNCLNVQDPKIFLKKLSSTNQRQATSTLRSLMPPSDDRQPILSSHHDDGCSVCCHH